MVLIEGSSFLISSFAVVRLHLVELLVDHHFSIEDDEGFLLELVLERKDLPLLDYVESEHLEEDLFRLVGLFLHRGIEVSNSFYHLALLQQVALIVHHQVLVGKLGELALAGDAPDCFDLPLGFPREHLLGLLLGCKSRLLQRASASEEGVLRLVLLSTTLNICAGTELGDLQRVNVAAERNLDWFSFSDLTVDRFKGDLKLSLHDVEEVHLLIVCELDFLVFSHLLWFELSQNLFLMLGGRILVYLHVLERVY